MHRGAWLTLPNVLSLSRVALAPVFLAARQPELRVALLVAAALTDMLDGWLARRSQATSRLGALLDPLADRVFVLAAVLAFLLEGTLSAAQGLVLLSRDVATTVGFVVARSVVWLRSAELRARPAGKLVTALQLAVLVAVLVAPATVPALVVVVGVVSAAAVADYVVALWRARAR